MYYDSLIHYTESQNSFEVNGLSQIASGCVCLGDVLTYKCIVPGGIATEWRGSALACDNNTILLQHDHFQYGNATGWCNNNTVDLVGQGLYSDGNYYVSILNVTLIPNINGKTIECVYKDELRDIIIGSETISTTALFSSKIKQSTVKCYCNS